MLTRKNQNIKIAVLLTAAIILSASTLFAQYYSDHQWNKRSGSISSSTSLNYGGGYRQAAQNYMNFRHGYGTGKNANTYTTDHIPASRRRTAVRNTPEQIRKANEAFQQADNLLNRIYNSPNSNIRNLTSPAGAAQNSSQQIEACNALLQQIMNDPTIWQHQQVRANSNGGNAPVIPAENMNPQVLAQWQTFLKMMEQSKQAQNALLFLQSLTR